MYESTVDQKRARRFKPTDELERATTAETPTAAKRATETKKPVMLERATTPDQPDNTKRATLEFDAETHTYKIKGRQVPSVTQILGDMGLVDTNWLAESGRKRGTMVAAATQLFDQGKTIVYGRFPDIVSENDLRGYVHAWDTFKAIASFLVTGIELAVCNETHGYAGTLDRLGVCAGKYRAIVDIKTGGAMPSYPLQTAGYANCLEGYHRRYGVTLRKDGTYRVKEHKGRDDRNLFLAAVSLWHWKERNKLNGNRTDAR